MVVLSPLSMTKHTLFYYFKKKPEIIRLAVLLCSRAPLLSRSVGDLMSERRVEISHD